MRDEFTLFIIIILMIILIATGFVALLVDIYLVLDEEIFSVSHMYWIYISNLSVFLHN